MIGSYQNEYTAASRNCDALPVGVKPLFKNIFSVPESMRNSGMRISGPAFTFAERVKAATDEPAATFRTSDSSFALKYSPLPPKEKVSEKAYCRYRAAP